MELPVVIIGAGFGGICAAVRLRERGIPFVVLERGDAVGGVWRENTYPGAACDVPSHLYSLSFAPKADWSRKYAGQREIRGYLESVARDFGVLEHVRLSTEVAGATFDAPAGCWTVRTTAGDQLRARAIIAATGQLSRPAIPRLPGAERFAGPAFHSAAWDHGVDLRGRRVAVVGTGASAIQLVPAIAGLAERVTVFQRSAPYVIPKADRAYGALERRLLRRFPALLRASRALTYAQFEQRGIVFVTAPWLGWVVKRSWRRHMERHITDPELRRRLTPDYAVGCKRILLSNDWYPAVARDDVDVITEPIATVEPDAIVTADGTRHPADVLVHGTGFHATELLAPMDIRGAGGQALADVWHAGAEAYLGVTVAGFPNLFVLYGPNTNLGHNSIIYMIESQVAYVLEALRHLELSGQRWVDVRPERQAAFVSEVEQRSHRTVWERGCTSWYTTADGRNTNNWPGYTFSYRRRTSRFDATDYAIG
ncbi:MAG TPA: NAD(P)/FAD-dependent oxidoreductase [Baekduia sp.]|nr:NAD(P)/FAD-dependent oxidoreductase [Baekduia sp.]